ncbi:MAG: acylphosphatase [Patescibacteria group bacterium]
MEKRLELKIEGRVQGVGFRFAALRKARELGLKGWVKNDFNGSVEIVAEGVDENLKELLDWCYNGSENSQVEAVTANWRAANDDFKEFSVLD